MTDQIQQTWRSGRFTEGASSSAEMQRYAQSFSALITRRNHREYAAIIVIIPVFIWFAVTAQTRLEALGHVLVILGALLVAFNVWRFAGAEDRADMLGQPVLERYRTQLLRQRRALSWVPLWYIAPFLPGFIMVSASDVLQAQSVGTSVAAALIPGLFVFTIFTAVWILNIRAGRVLAKELKDLDAVSLGD